MSVPSFNGETIFGVSYTVPVEAYEPRIQRDFFPGIQGCQTIAHGGCGGFAECTIFQTADSELTLSLFEAIWFNYLRGGGAYTLIDTLDRAWAFARLTKFRPSEPVQPDGPGVCRTYQARFEIPDLA